MEVGNDGTRPVAPICTGVMEGLVPETVLVGVLDRWTTVTPEVVAGLRKTSAILAKIPVGKGRVIVDQVNWEDEKAFAVGFQYITSLLTNLRIEFNHRVPAVRSMTGLFFPLSLKGWINHTLRTDLSGTPGPLPEGVNNLAALPSGPSVPIGDVPFDIGGLVVLRSPTHAPSTPAKVTGLRVDRKVNKLHFLHGCAWCGEGKVFAYVIHRADGTTETVAVAGGKNVLDWWMASWPLPGATVAWQGKNEVHMPITLYRVEWKNPRPEVTVASIDVVGEDGEAIPFVVGITAETRK